MDDYVILPAQPGFSIIHGDQEIPVVAWGIKPGSATAIPIVADYLGADPGTLLKYPGGYMDATNGVTHASYRDWESMQDGSGRPQERPNGSEAPAPAQSGPRPSQTTAMAPGAVGPYRIPFTGKTYKLVSFWQFDGEEGRFIFQMPADTPTPGDSRVQKVNRDEFNALKKSGVAVMEYEAVIAEPQEASDDLDATEAEGAPDNTADPEDDFI